MRKTFQGASKCTLKKELHIEGVNYMRLTQFKNPHFQRKIRRVTIADIFCGSGRNVVEDEYVDGSPIRILRGFDRAFDEKLHGMRFDFWFSDVKKSSCESLNLLLQNKFGYDLQKYIHPMLASDAINEIGNMLHEDRFLYVIMIVDPNGPKDFPRNELQDLIRGFSHRIDIIPYISATAINRCIGARDKAGRDFMGWLGEIENFDEGFVSSLTGMNRSGWIREPICGDGQKWTLIPTFGRMKPRNNWEGQGFYDLKEIEGKQIVRRLCGRFS